MWKGESSKFLVMECYWTITKVKPLQPVDETFCLIPTDDANCCYLDSLNLWASAVQYELAKRRSGNGGSAASPMIKSTKD